MRRSHDSHVAILGAGPVGLDAALATLDAGRSFTVYEAGPHPASHVREWGHVRLFSPWSLDVSPRMRRHLKAAGRAAPDGDACPTAQELVERVLDPVAELRPVRRALRLGTRVVAVGREGLLRDDHIGSGERATSPFRILLEGPDGEERIERADTVIDCTGTWGTPNPLGDGGIPAPGEIEAGAAIERTLPDLRSDRESWSGRRVLLVGAGHSARTAAAGLSDLPGTRVVWAVRAGSPEWGPRPDDPLPERARIDEIARDLAAGSSEAVEVRTGVTVEALRRMGGGYEVDLRRRDGSVESETVDRILALTGYLGDPGIYRGLQVHECWATGGPMKLSAALLGQESDDCLALEDPGAGALENPEPGFFILGIKSYGRNGGFLMRTGWGQVGEVLGSR